MTIQIQHALLFVLLVGPGCRPAGKVPGSASGRVVSPSGRVVSPQDRVVPTPEQVEYQKMETVGFIHFTINTFTGKEWGYGDEDPALFNPASLDAEQWARVARDGGLKQLILTAKHHDGFCLWPSAYTEHTVKSSPFRNGKGDVVREFVDACRKYGLKVGLYLSPWDRNHPEYGRPAYITYYRNQLQELLTGYGEINEIWFDGANGGDGYYGGANEERRIDRETYYDWENTFALVKELQPGIKIFSDAGPDIRWVGNEKGFAGETFWSTISDEELVIGDSDQEYLNRGDPEGNLWIVGQCDVSIRPGWFYHADEDSLVKSPQELVDIYYKSVGRNGVLLLNLPPDRRGLIHEKDAASLRAFRQIIDRTFATDLAEGSTVMAEGSTAMAEGSTDLAEGATDLAEGSTDLAEGTTAMIADIDRENLTERKNIGTGIGRKTSGGRSGELTRNHPGNMVDGDPETYWIADSSGKQAKVIIRLDGAQTFDRIMLQEPVRIGQRISSFYVEAEGPQGMWKEIARGTTIGYKRILRTAPVSVSKIRLVLEESYGRPAIARIGLFRSSSR
ncbi:MAG: alpha-L-fucosidase [Bacteroidales bacterium]